MLSQIAHFYSVVTSFNCHFFFYYYIFNSDLQTHGKNCEKQQYITHEPNAHHSVNAWIKCTAVVRIMLACEWTPLCHYATSAALPILRSLRAWSVHHCILNFGVLSVWTVHGTFVYFLRVYCGSKWFGTCLCCSVQLIPAVDSTCSLSVWGNPTQTFLKSRLFHYIYFPRRLLVDFMLVWTNAFDQSSKCHKPSTDYEGGHKASAIWSFVAFETRTMQVLAPLEWYRYKHLHLMLSHDGIVTLVRYTPQIYFSQSHATLKNDHSDF